MEEWKDIIGYEGKYQVSNLGRIKSLNYNNTGEEGILDGDTNKRGYKVVNLSKNGKGRTFLLHRLVAIAFIPNPNNLPEVNHINEDKNNNCVDNLEWCTSEYNANYGTRNKRISKNRKGKCAGKEHPNYGKSRSKETTQKMSENSTNKTKVINLDTGEIFDSMREAGKKYNMKNPWNISLCCTGKRKTAGGYHWAYYKE